MKRVSEISSKLYSILSPFLSPLHLEVHASHSLHMWTFALYTHIWEIIKYTPKTKLESTMKEKSDERVNGSTNLLWMSPFAMLQLLVAVPLWEWNAIRLLMHRDCRERASACAERNHERCAQQTCAKTQVSFTLEWAFKFDKTKPLWGIRYGKRKYK
jgi:hypothetical protein